MTSVGPTLLVEPTSAALHQETEAGFFSKIAEMVVKLDYSVPKSASLELNPGPPPLKAK